MDQKLRLESDHPFGGNSGDEALLSMTKPRQMIYKANACCFHSKFPLKVKYYYVGDILTHFVRTRALSKEGRVDWKLVNKIGVAIIWTELVVV